MGKGSKAPTDQTVVQSNLPEYAEPYFKRMMARTEAQSLEPYQAYRGQRLTDSTKFRDINNSRSMVRDIASDGIAGLPQAQDATSNAMYNAGALAQYGPGAFWQYDFGPERQFSGQEVQNYMSPYLENVLNVQKDNAVRDSLRAQAGRNASAVSAGAFGGARHGVQEAMAEEALMRQMGEIDATGRQAAFEAATGQFNADRAAQQQQRMAQAGELGRVQQAYEQSRQFGAGQGLQGLQMQLAGAQQLANLGQTDREASIQNAQLLETIGRQQQQEKQAGLDLAYEDFLRQQNYPAEQLAMYNAALRGLPIAPTGTQTTQQFAYYNPMQQLLGAGLSGLSLYKAFSA